MLLKTLGRLGLQDAAGVYTYQGVHGLLLLCYVVDRYYTQGRRQHNRELLADLLWPNSKSLKNRKNNLSGTLKKLREALLGEDVLRTCINSDPYDPSLELVSAKLSLRQLNAPRLVTVDFTVCETACAKRDLVTVAEVYEGVFLAGIEKRFPSVQGELLVWLQDKRSSIASNILEACLDVLAHSLDTEKRKPAQRLLEDITTHDPRVFIEPSLLADAHAHLPTLQRDDLAKRLLGMLRKDTDANEHVQVLMTLSLQQTPDVEVACQVQKPPLAGENKMRCKQFLDDGDWLQKEPSASQNKRLRGRAFWQRQVVAQNQHVWLLKQLWEHTPETPKTHLGLFYLAWHYHQGVMLAGASHIQPNIEKHADAKREGDVSLAQLIREDLAARRASNVKLASSGMGDFAGFDWGKLTRVFLHQAQQVSRIDRFDEVLALCNVWEYARRQRGELQNVQVVWFAVYALERQGDYGKAVEHLKAYAKASDHHQSLWASLLFRTGETAIATEMARVLVQSADAWAKAEAHALLAKKAYFAEDFTRAIYHYEHAKCAWIDAKEPCRAIAAEVGVASCYDCRAQGGDVQRADDIYNDVAEAIVRQDLPPLTALRTRLNQLMLWDYHDFKTPEEIREGFNYLIKTLEAQNISKEVLGKTWYNFGQHYYNHYQAYAEGVNGTDVDIHHPDLHHARVCYEKALEALKGSRDRVMYACACGELGRIYKLKKNQARANVFLDNTVKVLSDTKQESLLVEYQQLLAQENADDNFGHESGAA